MNRADQTRRKYLNAVRALMPMDRGGKRSALSPLDSSVETWLVQNPTADYLSLCEAFGAPKDVAASYLGDLSSDELVHVVSQQRNVWRVVLAAALAFILLVGSAMTYVIVRVHNSTSDYVVIELADEHIAPSPIQPPRLDLYRSVDSSVPG